MWVNIRMSEAIRPWTFVVDILYGYLMLVYFLYQDKTFQGYGILQAEKLV